MSVSFILLLLIAGIAGSWVARARSPKGTTQRVVATVAAVVFSLIGLTAVGFAVFFVIGFSQWGSNK